MGRVGWRQILTVPLLACMQPPPPPLTLTESHISAGRTAAPHIDTCCPASAPATLLPQGSYRNDDGLRRDPWPCSDAPASPFSPPAGLQRQHFVNASPAFLVAPDTQQGSDSIADKSLLGFRSLPQSLSYGAVTRPALEHPHSHFSDGDTGDINNAGGGCTLLGSPGLPAAPRRRGGSAAAPPAPGGWDVGNPTGGISAADANPASARSLSCMDPPFVRRPDSTRFYHQPTLSGSNDNVSTGFFGGGAAGPTFQAASPAHGQTASEMPAAAQLGASIPVDALDWMLPGSSPWGRTTTFAAMPKQRSAGQL